MLRALALVLATNSALAAAPTPATGVAQHSECRDPDWSCVADPCAACQGLCRLPDRALLVAIMVPLLVYKPKCTGSSPDLGSLALWFLFGTPMRVCPRLPPAPPAQSPPATQPGSAPVALLY